MHFYLKSESVIMKLIYFKNSTTVLWRSAYLFKFKQMTGPLKFKPVHKSSWQACAVSISKANWDDTCLWNVNISTSAWQYLKNLRKISTEN